MSLQTISNLNLHTLDQAVDLVRVNKLVDGSKEATYLRTYPSLLTAAKSSEHGVVETFLMTAAFVHGWMPTSLHVEPKLLDEAARVFDQARAEGAEFSAAKISAVAGCLQSLVAATKVLHFANPYLYPTWDNEIEHFRRGLAPSPYHMAQTANYVAYVEDIRKLKHEEGFLGFHHDYCMNYQQRLRQLAIPPYPLTDMRVVEAAVHEIIAAHGERF